MSSALSALASPKLREGNTGYLQKVKPLTVVYKSLMDFGVEEVWELRNVWNRELECVVQAQQWEIPLESIQNIPLEIEADAGGGYILDTLDTTVFF